MELVFQFTVLVVGLLLLWRTGELAVRHALGLSSIFGIHQFIVGFFIFAISTGLPEISSAIIASIEDVPELSVGDLMGSTFVNLSLILGILSLFQDKIEISLPLRNKLLKVSAAILGVVIWLIILQKGNFWNGLLLVGAYVVAIFWFQGGLPKEEAKQEIKEIEAAVKKEEKKPWISPKIDILIKLFGSLGLLLIASWVIVHSATRISALMGLNLTLLGGTILAIGTSFPELVLEIHAFRRKEYALALGNLFGASLLNITFTLGFLMLMNADLRLAFILKMTPFLLVILIWAGQAMIRKQQLSRKDGYVFLGVFCAYLITVFLLRRF